MTIPFFSNLAFVVLGYLLTYAAGMVVMALVAEPERSRYYEFKKLAFGVWLLITGYSVWHTGGHTLSLGLFFLALYAGFHYRPALRWRPVVDIKALAVQIGILLLFYGLLYFQVYDPFSQTLRYYPADLGAHATLVEKLNITGLESTHTDFFFREPVYNLYHFGDLWYPALFTRLFDMRAMESLWFLYSAFGATIITTGAFAFGEQVLGQHRLRRTDILLALGFIGLSAISFYVPKSGWLDARWPEHFTLISLPKVYWVAMAALFSLISLNRDDLMGFTLSLLTVCFLYVISAPAILAGWIFVLGYTLVTRGITWSGALRLAMPVWGMVVFFLGYVSFSGVDIPGFGARPWIDGFATHGFPGKKYFADVIYTVGYTSLRVLIAFWPFLLLSWFIRHDLVDSDKSKRTIGFLLAGMAGGILAYGLIYYEPDGFQLWSVPHACLMAILVFLLLLKRGTPSWLKLTVLGLCWYQNIYAYQDSYYFLRPYSSNVDFVNQISEHIAAGEGGGIAVMRKPVLRSEDPLWCSDPNQYFPYDFLKWKFRAYHPYNISLMDTELQDNPAWANFQRAYLRHSSFGILVNRAKQAGSFISIETSQRDFIQHTGVRFLLIEPGARPNPLLDPMIEKTYTDQQTGYRFCVLRNN